MLYNTKIARKQKRKNGGTMDLEEANFILEQVTLSKPCLEGYTHISVAQFEEAIFIINKELEERKNKIKHLEKQLKIEERMKYDSRIAEKLIKINTNNAGYAIV